MKIQALFLTVALSSPVLAQAPLPAPQFDWKLRLVKGQTWTQTVSTLTRTRTTAPGPDTRKTRVVEANTLQTFGLKSEVVEATPTFYLIRATYTQFDTRVDVTIGGKPAPGGSPKLPDVGRSFVGEGFTIKQARDGRVLDVQGLEEFLARVKTDLGSSAKTPEERAAFERFLPGAGAFKASIAKNQEQAFPKTPLAVGGSYSYAVSLPASFPIPFGIQNRRTLRAFDFQTATFEENATFSVAPTQLSGPKPSTVVLTRDAAVIYLMHRHRQQLDAQQTYLSRNGGVYFREKNDPSRVHWIAAPANGIRLSQKEAAPFRGFVGYNNQNSGQKLQSQFTFDGSVPTPVSAPDETQPVGDNAPKSFFAMSGTMTGRSVVDAQSGVVRSGDLTMRVRGKVTVVQPKGTRLSMPIELSSQTTIQTSP